jgi:hypothetical protein
VELEDAYPAIRRGRGLQLRGESDRRQAERARVQIEEARGDGVTVDATTGFLILHLPSVQPQRPEGSPVRRRQPLYLPGRLIAECGEPAVEPAPLGAGRRRRAARRARCRCRGKPRRPRASERRSARVRHAPLLNGQRARAEKPGAVRCCENGSDGTRTRDLRRDRPRERKYGRRRATAGAAD